MHIITIPAALVISFLIVLFFSLISGRSLSALWLILLIIFLATLTGQLWIRPFGPVTWGISWVPLFVVAIFFSLFIFALLPPAPTPKAERQAEEGALIVMGAFFWIMMILLIVSIFVGYYRITVIK